MCIAYSLNICYAPRKIIELEMVPFFRGAHGEMKTVSEMQYDTLLKYLITET